MHSFQFIPPQVLMPCWMYSFGAAVSLCLLGGRYALVRAMVSSFETREVPLQVFAQLDRLVSLLETPVFAFLRLHLCQGDPDLLCAMHGLLAILPQSDAFRCVSCGCCRSPLERWIKMDEFMGQTQSMNYGPRVVALIRVMNGLR